MIVLAAHNKSGEIVACSVKEAVKTEWLPDLRFSLSPHSLIQCMSAGFHTEQSFSFSPLYASFFSSSVSLHLTSSFHISLCLFLRHIPPVVVSFLMGGPGWSLLSVRGAKASPVGQ